MHIQAWTQKSTNGFVGVMEKRMGEDGNMVKDKWVDIWRRKWGMCEREKLQR